MLTVTEEYMAQMDSSMNDKELMLNYVVGNTVMDMGCGSGGILELLRKKYPGINRIGIDKDLKYLKNKMYRLSQARMGLDNEGMNLQLIQDDVCNLNQHVKSGEVDTFIFSSILHEVYSYKEFKMSPVNDVLMHAITLLPKGGRLIIRDGVKPETNNVRYLTFTTPSDIQKVFGFVRDFKGRKIEVTTVNNNTVMMNEQDAMEFLYTYTWGDDHYEREIQEQYGLFTPTEWIKYILDTATKFHCKMKLVTYNHYLQEGYNYYLSKRVEYLDEFANKVKLPDSNGLFIFEKE
jgi:SAM-dependent methyltransferase